MPTRMIQSPALSSHPNVRRRRARCKRAAASAATSALLPEKVIARPPDPGSRPTSRSASFAPAPIRRVVEYFRGSPERRPGKLKEKRSGLWPFFDCVDAIGVEGEIIFDRRDGGVGSLITPHRVDRTLAAERNAEIAAIPFV